MKQKDGQLTELRKGKTDMEEQLAAGKALAGKLSADLKARSAQLNSVLVSQAAQQAVVQPAADSAQPTAPTPQVYICCCSDLQAT